MLYVDDNVINTMLMAAMFERLPGLDLRCTSSPHQCLALAVADPPALLRPSMTVRFVRQPPPHA